MLPKIAAIRQRLGPHQRLEVDGGINPQTARLCAEQGADTYVSGTDLFGAADMQAAVRELRAAITLK
jgi:ribulose-phosphate 3-epimerase